jgi:DNA-binding LacI/PurR family transcriptional regulator
VVHNEAAVAPVLTVLAELGRRVPRDVSVVAICPDQVAMGAVPPLSSVLVPAEEVGRQAVGLLMRKLGGAAVPEATLLIPSLTERQSTIYLTA